MRIVGLVQARMGSVRLPGKVMAPLAGKPLVAHIFDRLAATRGVSCIVLATSTDASNDPLAALARSQGIEVFRAEDEEDITARLLCAATACGADRILKVNGDCPLVDPKIMSRMVEAAQEDRELDYISNKILWTWPEGYSAEVISIHALEWCNENLVDPTERTLVANWIRDHNSIFKRHSIERHPPSSLMPSLAVDTQEDLSLVETLFEALYPLNPLFGYEDVEKYINERTPANA